MSLRLGVNYTPRQGWFHSWLDLDLDQVRRDFDAIAALGLDHVRVFPLWPLLQPNRTLIRETALQDVVDVVDAAAQAGLDTTVDVLQGHLSSFDFVPSWLSSWHERNMFTDPDVVQAQSDLVEAMGARLTGRPGAMGLSVGNEIIQFAAARHPGAHVIDSEQADAWLTRMLQAARRSFPTGLHTHSFDDDLWFEPGHPFTPAHAVEHGDLTTVHSWVFSRVGPRYGPGHPVLAWFARYLIEVARAWSPGNRRELWLQEVGAPSSFVTEHEAPAFLRQTLMSVSQAPGLWGVTWWCSHDVQRSLADFPELEHTLGLFDEHGAVKPIGRELARLAPILRESAPAPEGNTVEVIDVGTTQSTMAQLRSSLSPQGEIFPRWCQAYQESGSAPSLRLPAVAGRPGGARAGREGDAVAQVP